MREALQRKFKRVKFTGEIRAELLYLFVLFYAIMFCSLVSDFTRVAIQKGLVEVFDYTCLTGFCVY